MGEAIRTVVTGVAQGRSKVTYEGLTRAIMPAAMPGYEFYPLWGSDTPVVLPTGGARPEASTVFPPAGGSRFWMIRFPPAISSGAPAAPQGDDPAAELAEMLPGLGEAMEPDHPGMHMTATVDYAVVLEGAIELELEDGEIVRLEQGTALVQNGTRHAWRPAADGPCLVAFAMIGAERR